MRSRTGFAFAFAVSILALNSPAAARPAARTQVHHVHKPLKKTHVAAPVARAVAVPETRSAFDTARDLWTSARNKAVPALVLEARKYMGTNPTDRKRLWCARFMNFVLAKLGYEGTNSDAAKSFAEYGHRIAEPRVGAIAVLTRGRHGGHVGVVSGIDKSGNPIIISGNHTPQGVGEGVYARSRVIAYVMPAGQRAFAAAPKAAPAGPALDSPITELLAAIQAEQPRAPRVNARAPAARPAQVVPRRTVQQTPDQRANGVSDPFSELMDSFERPPTRQRRVL